MAVATVQMVSDALERRVHYNLILPDVKEAGAGPYPVLLQLHGYWDDYNAWLYKSNILRYVEKLPLIVVLPDGANSFYTNLGRPNNFEDFVIKDLWEHVNSNYAVRPGKWAIGGLSMGGFGAIKLGLKYPDKFCSIFAHSSRIPDQDGQNMLWENSIWSIEHRAKLKREMDCYQLARDIDRANLPSLSFDCGTEDWILDDNRKYQALLEEIKLPHSYAEHPGGHDWDYWDTHIKTALQQHAEVLGIKPKLAQS